VAALGVGAVGLAAPRGARSIVAAMRTRVRFLPVVLAVTVLAVACGGGDGDSDSSANDPTADLPAVADSEFVDMTGKSEVVIEAKDNKFEPQFVTVSPGTKITFENKGRNPHNVIPVDKSQFEAVPTDEFQPDDSATISVDDAGVYPYYCSLHGTPSAGMDGRIRVADA
jgi:plastocyanin